MAQAARVKVMLTARERAGLLALGYSPEEAEDMRFEIVAHVLERRVQRPFGTRAMPAEWRRGKLRSGAGNALLRLCVLALAAGLIGWLLGVLPSPDTLKPFFRRARNTFH
eukprot:TRINITY_DN39577_c0_g1_i1.p1 TRINITY_DN39577_c0_g1~~TRINITY_DN39577_c0_g1_i1.p1  ORF type:complete len:128 (+),score=22.06 TRINITY_DN39577_c0_g1_i1:57-386(+)